MKLNRWIVVSLGVTLVFLVLVFNWIILPVASEIYSLGKTDATKVAYRDNYELHTTPLSEPVVSDLCVKLKLVNTSELCNPGEVVYAPELFNEVKSYFNNLPSQDKTYDVVQDSLGSYLVFCSPPEPDGYFRCRYDFKGDGVYPVFFDFDNNGFYWQIIANTGGS